MIASELVGVVLGYLGIIVGLGWLVTRLVRARLTPRDLRGDWWSLFEREFHAYSSQQARSSRIDKQDV
jgi:hypothetical protein